LIVASTDVRGHVAEFTFNINNAEVTCTGLHDDTRVERPDMDI